MVNVLPISDQKPHVRATYCSCLPKVEWFNDDGTAMANGPLIIHNAFDGREYNEWDGTSAAPGKLWEVVWEVV